MKKSPSAGTSTSRKIRHILSLQNSLTALLAFVLYCFLTTSLLSTPPLVVQESDVHPHFFSTEEKSPLKASLIFAIGKAERKITLLIYNLCDTQIIRALRQAGQRGVDVTVIVDPSSSEDIRGLQGPNIHTYVRKPKGLMHLKIFLIDGKEVWLGSANMSISSLEVHGNLFSAFHSPTMADYIEKYAVCLIEKQSFNNAPLVIESDEQSLRLFLHPCQGKESLSYLIERIDQAKTRVFVAMYTFTQKELLNSLIRAKERGVDVRVVFDKDSSKNTSKLAFTTLRRSTVSTRVRTRDGLLHHKFAWIDNSLAMGSCNWTKSGFMANCDCIVWFQPLNEEEDQHMMTLWQEIEGYST